MSDDIIIENNIYETNNIEMEQKKIKIISQVGINENNESITLIVLGGRDPGKTSLINT